MQVLSREMIPYVYVSDESLCIHEAHSPCSCSSSPEGSLGSKASPNTTMDGVPDALIGDAVELARGLFVFPCRTFLVTFFSLTSVFFLH